MVDCLGTPGTAGDKCCCLDSVNFNPTTGDCPGLFLSPVMKINRAVKPTKVEKESSEAVGSF